VSALLEVLDCHTYRNDVYVLHGVTVRVEPAQVSVVVGRNGVGKTTLVRTIMGLTPPREGAIRFLGEETVGLPPERVARMGLGLVPQGRGIFPSLRVRENLTVVGHGPRDTGWTFDRVLERFPQLRDRSGAWGDQLSGGEQQMLAIARVLLMNPRCVILDEPFEGLAPTVIEEVIGVLRDLRNEGIGILLMEQRVGAALALADHVYVMGKGAIVFDGTTGAFAQRADIQSAYLGVSG
jgi:branched-chain amino acid transport system ATP-binding protein